MCQVPWVISTLWTDEGSDRKTYVQYTIMITSTCKTGIYSLSVLLVSSYSGLSESSIPYTINYRISSLCLNLHLVRYGFSISNDSDFPLFPSPFLTIVSYTLVFHLLIFNYRLFYTDPISISISIIKRTT